MGSGENELKNNNSHSRQRRDAVVTSVGGTPSLHPSAGRRWHTHGAGGTRRATSDGETHRATPDGETPSLQRSDEFKDSAILRRNGGFVLPFDGPAIGK